MTALNVVDFLSKECKNLNHSSCQASWYGFGFTISCECPCHIEKKGLTETGCGPTSVATNSLEETKEIDQE